MRWKKMSQKTMKAELFSAMPKTCTAKETRYSMPAARLKRMKCATSRRVLIIALASARAQPPWAWILLLPQRKTAAATSGR